ncbi:MAG: hypothetical protein Q8Q67_01900 [bacterium]|nr:hypothetical protein [bacterium]
MENQNKTLLIVIITLIVVAAVALYVTQSPTRNSGDADLPAQGNDLADVYSSADRVAFEAYLRENLSELSPEKEVLGGTFYLTALDWETDREAYVGYEDGHIALNARVGFSMGGADNDIVQVDYFNIIPVDQVSDEAGDMQTQVVTDGDASAEIMIVE